MLVGYSQEGLPINFDEASAEIIYKDTRVSIFKIKSALDSGLDTYKLADNLEYSISGGFTNFGCLTLSTEKTNLLFKSLWKQLRTYSKVGS